MANVPIAPPPPNIPGGLAPGLEFLLPTNQLIIENCRDWGIFSTTTGSKQYSVLDAWERRIFFAAEDSSDLAANCGGADRNWQINIFNCMGVPVLTGSRIGGRGCDSNECMVSSPVAGLIGGIVENQDCCKTSWHIVDRTGAQILFLDAPPLSAGFFSRDFHVMTLQGQDIGKITRYQRILSPDSFGVDFPLDLDPNTKAVLMYAAFLIDFQFYTQDSRHHRNNH